MPHMSNLPWLYMYIIVFFTLVVVFLSNSNQKYPNLNWNIYKIMEKMTMWKW